MNCTSGQWCRSFSFTQGEPKDRPIFVFTICYESIEHLDLVKNQWDSHNKNILLLDKANLELKSYEDSLNRGTEKLNQYRKIKEMVEKNKQIDTDIQKIKFKIDSLDEQKNMSLLNHERFFISLKFHF